VLETLANQLVQWLLVAPFLVCFLGAFIAGTVVTLVFATFAGSAGVPWLPLLLGAFLGNYTKDSGIFALARSDLTGWVRRSRHYEEQRERLDALRDNYRKRDVVFFIALKFAYGLRIMKLLLLGAAHYPWGRFLWNNAFAVLAINATAVLAGWMFGRGATRYLDLFENAGTIISTVIFVVLAFLGGKWLISRYMLSKR
jgi:membrane protein DedA with SNARE-associated domain